MPRRPRNLTRALPWGAGSVRQRGDEWEARWTEGSARPSRPFPTKEAAEDFLIARHRRKLRGGYIAPVEMTVADLLESYIERSIAYGKWKPATINLNRRLADHHILPTLKDLRVIEVEPPRLQRWVDTLARTLSPATVSMCAALLSAAFKQAVTLTIIPSNPCSVVSRPKVEQKPMVTWSVEDIAKVDAFLRDEPKWLAVYRLMLTTGMRPGELYALTWSDLDFEQNIVRIRRTITDNAEGKRVVGATPKGGKTRYVALSRSARAALLDWQAALVLRSLKADTDYVFPSRRGSPMGENVWLGMHAHIIQRTGVPPINLHSLRHTSATLELAAGTPIKIVSERLGHRDPLFTMRIYMHVDANLQRSASDAMDERLFGLSDLKRENHLG
jgi:integrase